MRDLGLMGESIFELWCADAGLIPNKSQVDKTGWDFIVEFPFSKEVSTVDVHKSAFECKVQVKATDKRDRKLPITLSNLRRLVTAQIPAFFVFIEFDGQSTPQHAFVVHVDSSLITNVLKRLYTLEQGEQESNFNKRTMTVYYTETDELEVLDGECLKRCLIKHIGYDLSDYITKKKTHLEFTGFEEKRGEFSFTTKGEENFQKLIDVSLGLEVEVEVSNFKRVDSRFGILSKSPVIRPEAGFIRMPDLKPRAKGKVVFKDNKLSVGLPFNVELFVSPFSKVLDDKFNKLRLKGDFFELQINFFTGQASFSYAFNDIELDIKRFRDAVKLMLMLKDADRVVFVDMIFDGLCDYSFSISCHGLDCDATKENEILKSAFKIINEFDFSDFISVSLDDILFYGKRIKNFNSVLELPPNLFSVEFSIFDKKYINIKEVAFIFFANAPIGGYWFGTFIVLLGVPTEIEIMRYRLVPNKVVKEYRVVFNRNKAISSEDLDAIFIEISKKYQEDFFTIIYKE